jgi:hypothetical protein
MKEYKVIHIDFKHPSFNWGNGLYAIIDTVDGDLEMCQIRDGIPDRFDDGSFMITVTGASNPGITETNLTLKI